MAASDFAKKYAIVGASLFSGPTGQTVRMMAAEAARLAIEDAGLRREDIDGAIDAIEEGGAQVRSSYSDPFPRVLGLPVNAFVRAGGRGASQGAISILLATQMINVGIANYVVVAMAKDELTAAQEARHRGVRGGSHRRKSSYWGTPFGDLRAVSHHSFFMTRHKALWGTTERQQAMVPVSLRKWANLNPKAKLYGRTLTLEDYFNAPILVWPYRLFDICQITDGGTAFVVASAERARDLKKPPVYIMGVGIGEHTQSAWWERRNHDALPLKTGKEQAFRQAGVALEDIDFVQAPDCFSAEVILHVEDYGWCAKGEGGAFIEEGNIAPGGKLPFNTSGGWNSAYHFGDMTHINEAVLQLRGEAGDRQLKKANIGIAAGGGGELLSPGMCSIHSTIVLGNGK